MFLWEINVKPKNKHYVVAEMINLVNEVKCSGEHESTKSILFSIVIRFSYWVRRTVELLSLQRVHSIYIYTYIQGIYKAPFHLDQKILILIVLPL